MNGYKKFQLKSNSTESAITIALVFMLIHGFMFGFGWANDTSLLSGDRSASRDTTISYVFNIEKIGVETGVEIDNVKPDQSNSHVSDSTTQLDKRTLASGKNNTQASGSSSHIGTLILASSHNNIQKLDSIAYIDNRVLNADLNDSLALESAPGNSDRISDRILRSGHAGDYLIQGTILALGNRHLLVGLQLALSLLATLCFFALLKHSGFSVPTATLSTLFYLLLPGSLLPAHQLSSEALFIPSIIIACYLLVISSEKKGIDTAFVAGLLALSMAIFVRPQMILFPFLLLVIYYCFSLKKISTIVVTVIPISLLFTALWMAVVVTNDSHFSLGGENHSVYRSFHDTAEQMAMSGDFEFDSNAYQSRKMPAGDFAEIVADNSPSYIRQRTTSMINFFVNTGAYSLAVRHLDYFEKNKDDHYWQHLRARSGIHESILEILEGGPAFTILIIGSTLVWCLVLLSAVVGLSAFIADKNIKRFAKVLLLTLAAYQVTIVMLFSVGARWQHRSLIDFIIVILAIYGLKSLRHYLNARKLSTVY